MNRVMLGVIGVVISILAIPKNITGRKYGEQIYNMFLMPILFLALLYVISMIVMVRPNLMVCVMCKTALGCEFGLALERAAL